MQAECLAQLRRGLELQQAGTFYNGAPRWVLYDPLQHKFFELTKTGVEVFRRWQPGLPIEDFKASLAQCSRIFSQMNSIRPLRYWISSSCWSSRVWVRATGC